MKRCILLLLILVLTVTSLSGCSFFTAAVIAGGRQTSPVELELTGAFLNAVERFDWQDPQTVRDLVDPVGTWDEDVFTSPDGSVYHAYVYTAEKAFCEIDVCAGQIGKTGSHAHGNISYDAYWYPSPIDDYYLHIFTFCIGNVTVYVTESIADGEEQIFESLFPQDAYYAR